MRAWDRCREEGNPKISMEKRTSISRRELLDRWRDIEEEDDLHQLSLSDPSKQRRIRQAKEHWFSDTFNFLMSLSTKTHIWCSCWDLMRPLLETFHNYFMDKRNDSPLKLIWKRISQELRQCTQCICQHHEAQEAYDEEYELNSISPLLSILRSLDEERVTEHLKEINARIAMREYDPEGYSAEVVSVMFEVLMFPILLEDQSLVNEFQIFIEAVDNSHELTLAGHQQYPGVYTLLFLKSGKARSIGLRLAGYMGKLRRATDLEPLQPMLKKCIGFLETEVLPSTSETSRPRVQLERITVWLGIKSLLGFIEPSAFEEGILERYPIFLSIVLNHVSDDTLEFSYAITCLRLFFEMLGCKLWLRTTLSPSVMRNTLLGQCFHTRNEKSHKEIFDLFEPFLQSLEALQDGEHEKQRRLFLYFLLHQVTQSSNFSILMRKKARKIAHLIIHRGYKMNPPCPPFECSHMWGPSLVCSLKDSSLHNSLRQPAFDLIHTIIVSDAAALVSLKMKHHASLSIDASISADINDDEDDIFFSHDVEEKESSCWSEFSVQSKLTYRDCKEWMCMPMLWFDVLIEIDPSALPISFSKAVFWALSRFSMVEAETGIEMALPVRDWLSSCAQEISVSFGWDVPNGSDDGGDGKESKNSIKASKMCIPLIRTFKRCAAHFVIQMEQGELRKQWTWEPRMAESLILLLIDPNDNVRQVDRLILEHVSKTRGLACGLKFLCSSASSLSAIYLGLRYALKLVQLDSVVANFHSLHHLFFVMRKLLKEVVQSPQKTPCETTDGSKSKFLSEGGFLHQPPFSSFVLVSECSSNFVDKKYWNKFICLLSETLWAPILKSLVEGKAFIDNKCSQMTCVRLLEILPVIFERLSSSLFELSGSSYTIMPAVFGFKWIHDLMDWGKSSLVVVFRHWKQSVLALLNLLKDPCQDSAGIIMRIEKLLSCDNVPIDELKEQASVLSLSLSREAAFIVERKTVKKKPSVFEGFSFERKVSATMPSSYEETDVQILDNFPKNTSKDTVIILSDDETEKFVSPDLVVLCDSSLRTLNNKMMPSASDKTLLEHSHLKKPVSVSTSKNLIRDDGLPSQKLVNADAFIKKQLSSKVLSSIAGTPTSLFESKGLNDIKKEINDLHNGSEIFLSQNKSDSFHKNPSYPASYPKRLDPLCSMGTSVTNVDRKMGDTVKKELGCDPNDDPWEAAVKCSGRPRLIPTKPSVLPDTIPLGNNTDIAHKNSSNDNADLEKRDALIHELIHDTEDDPWELAVKSARRPLLSLSKSGVSVSKRQVIQLNMPMRNKSGSLQLESVVRRFKPPRLDDWYRPILEIDYFSTVGIASANEDENATVPNLKEVPTCFVSPDHYVEIFRPLVLEEFKAQLHNSYAEASSSEEMCCGSLCVLSVERIDDFHLIRCLPDDCESAGSRGFSENDLVLLTKLPLQNSPHNVHMVGKVERREKDNKRRSTILVIRFFLQNGSSRLNKAKRFLTERSKWYVSRIMSITPQLREFQALSSLKNIPLLPIILNPIEHSCANGGSKKVELGKLSRPLERMLKSSFNDSQLQAISGAIVPHDSNKTIELSLIQGPPGTGKTKTIVAIVSALLVLGSSPKKDASIKLGSSVRPTCINPRVQVGQSVSIERVWQDAAVARQLCKEGENVSAGSMESCVRGRVLICAQSNAAVDELVSRITNEGICGNNGQMYKPYLVRIGNSKTVHPNSLPYFIDTLVEQRLTEEKSNQCDTKNDMDVDYLMTLRSNLEKLVDDIRFYEAKRANLSDGNLSMKKASEDGAAPKEDDGLEMSDPELGAKLKILYAQKRGICVDLGAAQACEKKTYEDSKALKQKLRKSILREAEIVVTTLSGCGGDLYGVCSDSISSSRFGNSSERSLFDAVVIDEAAQALEPATLIPLQLLKSNGTKCIMVGDPKQLPATVLSNVASKFFYECSMFERLQRAGHPVVMLTEQYRMHPEICKFPSSHFYDNKLLNGDRMASKSALFHENKYLGPYVFFDVIDGREHHAKNSAGLSLYNESEVDAAVEILRFLKQRYPSHFVGRRIGIITPYKSQVSWLRSRLTSTFGPDVTADMEFNTVDGFQGREVDILILSTVRASDSNATLLGVNSTSIGFVADVRRMNVALTRAKISLWIVGNARTLKTNLHWDALLKDAEERNLVISVARPYDSLFWKPLSSSKRKITSASIDSHSECRKKVEMVKNTSSAETGIEPKEIPEAGTKHINDIIDRHAGRHVTDHDLTKTDGNHKISAGNDIRSGVVPQPHRRPSEDVESPTVGSHVAGCEGKVEEAKVQEDKLGTALHAGKKTKEKKCSGTIRVDRHAGRHVTDRNLARTDGNHKISTGKDLSSAVFPQRHHISSEDVKFPMVGRHVAGCEGKVEETNGQEGKLSTVMNPGKKAKEKKSSSGTIRADVNLETNAAYQTLVPKGGSKTSECSTTGNPSQSRLASLSSTESSHKKREANNGNSISTQEDTAQDLIETRKRQRDAVDALLSSALISTKKPETSMKSAPVKRPLSPNAGARDVIKPPKPSKGHVRERGTGSERPRFKALKTKETTLEWRGT